ACEGMGAQGDTTPNSVMNWVEKQVEQGKQKKAADEIKERLELMVEHITLARARIERYAEFAARFRKQLAGQTGYAPLSSIADTLQQCASNGLAAAASPERARTLASEVAALLDRPDARQKCPALGDQLRVIGAAQDGSLARCRMAVRRLRLRGRI